MSASCTRESIVIIIIITVAIRHRHRLSFVVRRSRLHFGLRFRPTCPSLSSSCRLAISFPISVTVLSFIVVARTSSFFFDLSHRLHHRSNSYVVFVMILSSSSSLVPSSPSSSSSRRLDIVITISATVLAFMISTHRPHLRLRFVSSSSRHNIYDVSQRPFPHGRSSYVVFVCCDLSSTSSHRPHLRLRLVVSS